MKNKMNLQLFASNENEDPKDETNEELETDTNETNNDQEDKLFTEKEVDQRVSNAIKKREAALNKEMDSKIEKMLEERIKEQKRLGELSEDERKLEEFNSKIKDLETREQAILNKELKSDMIVEIAKIGLEPSSELVNLLVRDSDTNAEEALLKLNAFKEILQKSTQDVLDQKLKDSNYVPKIGTNKELTKEDFKKMTIQEKTKLYNENKELYDSLSK